MKQNNRLHTCEWMVGGLVLCVLFLAAWVFPRGQVAADQSPAAAPQPTNPGSAAGSSSTAGSIKSDEYFLQELRQALENSELNEADRQALQKNLELSERLVNQRAAAPRGGGPKGTLSIPVPMPQQNGIAPAEPQERIVAGSEGMIHSWEASITNLWEGIYQGSPYQVFAGAAPDNPAQGLVIVIDYSTNQPNRKTYQAPALSGALRIGDRQGSRLRLTAVDGSTVYFDLETLSFQE